MRALAIASLLVVFGACSEPESGDDGPDATATPRSPRGASPDPASPAGGACGEEVCDGIDNDCDGQVDEVGCICTAETVCYGGPPATRGIGRCTDGVRACDSTGELFGECSAWIGPTEELCNDVDDDCDGQVDEQCCAQPPCGATPPPGDDAEERFVAGEVSTSGPVDFVMAVDNSNSMDDTIREVEDNLGTFATRLVGAGVDYHFVLISEKGRNRRSTDVCIPPPMAGPECSDTDRYIHLDNDIGSHSALTDIWACHQDCDDVDAGYVPFLRPGALIQFIVVTDDESRMDWPDFSSRMNELGHRGFVLHGVVGLREDDCVEEVGATYIEGARATGGALLHICDNDWGEVLDVILDSTVVQLQSRYRLQARPDPASIRVFTVGSDGVEREAIGAWTWDPASNSVVFDPAQAPPAGHAVIVRYRRA